MSTNHPDDATGNPAASAEKYPPPPPETPVERKGRMIALFVMPFLIVTMMYATYMGTMHDPQPRDLPVAVVGAGAAADRFAEELEAGSDGALEVRRVADVAEAEDLVRDQEVAGAIAVPAEGQTATVYRAMASGASQATLVDRTLGAAAIAESWQVETVDVVPLPEGDGSGTMALFAAMGMMLAGYVPLSGMLLGTPNLLRVRRFLPIAVGWGALTSSLVWLVLGPLVGAVDGHYPLFLGVGTLAVTAVASAQLLFTKVLGPFAVLLGMLLWVVFGVPSSNLALSVHAMPGFLQWLHGVLPLPAAGEAIRSAVYFDGAGFWGHVLTLALWLVVGLGLAVLKERRSGDLIVGGPLYTEPDAPLPALSGGPVAPYRRRLVAVALFPLSIVVTVVTLMSLSMHQPDIRDMPVAVVGPADAAGQVVDQLEPALGDYLDLQVVGSQEEATDLIRSQDVVAAYVLPGGAGESPTLVTAGGAGASQQSAVTQMFAAVAAEGGGELATEDIAPLTEDDTGGSNSMYVGMGWIMAGFLFFAVMRGGAPDLTRTRQLLPLVAGWSVGISVWLWFLYDVLIGAVNGHALELIGYGTLTVFAVAWASATLIRVGGLGALVPVMIVVMLAGVPASGGGLSIYMVPEFFRPLADILPLPAAVDLARSLVYLDGTGVGGDLLVIAIWGIVGLALNFLVVDRWLNRPGAAPHAPMGPRYRPERPAKSADTDTDTDGGADGQALAGASRAG
ncbi:ABC transporter permease [Nocardioides sp. zg-579]|uniref:ABC transporter permease n=1 Tax=Nocardioides marmotae TaxID=2663857 RepID=A0A6I3J5W5_9ACTN|nr:ABC transporter permease [Nocardioides marmotae]MCR6031125.1 ABC transporter permease [Gordonia jinghuaiqii]MTB94764.1 ABC transporter permease [Nocardioides marmotae]QKE01239.1 ABC transporter permease [Nocardioides marmotae]